MYLSACVTRFLHFVRLLLILSVCACAHVGLLCFQVLQKPTPEQKQQLAVHSKHVAACVTELVQTAEAMKGEATHTADTPLNTHKKPTQTNG